MTLTEKKNLFEARLEEIQRKHSLMFCDLETKEYGAGKIKYHIISNEQYLSENIVRFSIGLNNTSIAPDYIKVEIRRAIDEVFKST